MMRSLSRSVVIAALTFVALTVPVLAYSDVDADHVAYRATQELTKAGKLAGGERFDPDRTATRCEFVKVLVAPIPQDENLDIIRMPYADVDESSWCGQAVKYALKTGVLTGKGTAFRPSDPIILVDAVRLVYRRYDSIPLIDRLVSVRNYRDVDASDTTLPLYQIEQAVIDAVVEPESETRLGLTRSLTRSDTARMIYRAWDGYGYAKPTDLGAMLFGNADARTKLAFLGVLNNINADYLYRKDINYDNLLRALINAAVTTLGDKYTQYFSPEEFLRFQEEDYGLYVGMGVQLDTSGGNIRIAKVYEGSAAAQAGLLPGDIIITVNGKDVARATLEEFFALFVRRIGEKVTVEVARGNEPARRSFTVTLTKFIVPDVTYRSLDNGIAVFAVESFGENAYAQFRDLYLKNFPQPPKGIVVDLRGDGGGQLSAATDLASLFLPRGTVIARIADASGTVRVIRTNRAPLLRDIPVVVLVDGGTASASELFALALRDGRQAPIIGTKTFGKGLVQRVFPYPDGSAFKVTSYDWRPAKSASIQGVGIVPDQEVSDVASSSADEPLLAAIAALSKP